MELFGNRSLLTRQGREVPADSVLSGQIVGLYFAAAWCLPSRDFTPTLLQFYKQLQQRAPHFQVVFMSCDKNVEEMNKFIQEQHADWLVLPFDDPLHG